MFASHNGATQVDGGDAIECGFSDLVERGARTFALNHGFKAKTGGD
jgi:hypothetical protein